MAAMASAPRAQAFNQALDASVDRSPIRKPVARKTHHNVGMVDTLAVETHAGRGAGAVAAAAHDEALGCGGVTD